MTTTIRFTAPVEIQAAKGKGPRRFTTVAYTGIPVYVAGYSQAIVVDLAGLTTRRSVTANLDHDATKRVGHIDDVQNDGRQLVLAGVVSAANAAAKEFVTAHDNGYPWQASIEALPLRIEHVGDEVRVEVNGQTFQGPLYVARKSELSAVAFVPNGADDSTHVSIAAQRKREQAMKQQSFLDFIREMLPSDDPADMPSETLAALHANYSGRNHVTDEDRAAVAPMIQASSDPVEAEARRLRQIERATDGEWGTAAESVSELKAKSIAGELSVDNLILELRRVRRERVEASIPMAHTVISGTNYGWQSDANVITAAFCLAGGFENPEKHFPEPVLEAADRMRRHVGLQQIIMRAACDNGYRAGHAENIHQGNLRQVLQAAFAPIHAAGFSTVPLPGILSNTANKFLVDGWTETSGDEWQKISEVKPVKNFHEAKFYRLLESAEYQEVGAGGELKHGKFGEQSMTVQAATYGRMYAITRTDIINDDLGALTDVPRRLGRAAGMKFRRIFWGAFLLDAGAAFWNATNGNVLTGAGTALTVAGTALDTALATFRAMRTSADDGRKLIGGKPATLMVPPALEIVARRLLTSTGIVAGGDTAVGIVPSGNPFAGLCELVVVDWLSDSDLTGYSAAKWYLLRSPNIAPAMLVAFLNGMQSPTVETADADFNVLGIQMRGYHDWGVGRGEPLCGLQVAGTA